MDNLGYSYNDDEDKPPAYDTSTSRATTSTATQTKATATSTLPVTNNNSNSTTSPSPTNTNDEETYISLEKEQQQRQQQRNQFTTTENSNVDDGGVRGGGFGGGDHELSEEDQVIPGRCGLFCWKPQWMQRFPTKHWFIAVFLLATIIKGMSGSYYPSTVSSVEKRLKVSTETIGYITSGNEISQIMFSLILSYIGGKGHRPRWMAFGILASAVSYFLYATPHFLYGPGNEALSYTAEYYSQFHSNMSAMNEMLNSTEKSTARNLTADLNSKDICKSKQEINSTEIDCGFGDDSIVPLGLIFVSQFVAGVGSVLLYTLAGPYIDDHMKPLQAPVMIALTGAVRQIGPLIGYIVAYFCLRLFISPWLTPLITNQDDRWIGAWWLGSVFYAILMSFVSMLMVLFPRVLRTSKKKDNSIKEEINLEMNAAKTDFQITVRSSEEPESHNNKRIEPIFQQTEKDLTFWASLVDLFKNKANTWNNLSILCFGFAFSGFATYFPKYLETVVKQNAANAALTTGLSSIFFQVAGLLLSGFVIAKFRLRARTLAVVNVIVDFLIVAVVFSFSQLVCKQGQVVDTTQIGNIHNFYHNIEWGNNSMTTANSTAYVIPFPSLSSSSAAEEQFEPSCHSNCNCGTSQNTPVCYQEKNLLYFSACHAGCKSFDPISQVYTNCSCLPSPDVALVPGKCVDPNACFSTFVLFVSLMALVRFGSSFGRIGNILIPYRCVDRSQKSLASGLSFAMWSIVSIPSPIMYGKIIDSACLRWGTKCGERGNCLLYDDTKFAYAMSTTAAGLALLGMICDVMVWYYVKDLKLYGDDEKEAEESKHQQQHQQQQQQPHNNNKVQQTSHQNDK